MNEVTVRATVRACPDGSHALPLPTATPRIPYSSCRPSAAVKRRDEGMDAGSGQARFPSGQARTAAHVVRIPSLEWWVRTRAGSHPTLFTALGVERNKFRSTILSQPLSEHWAVSESISVRRDSLCL